MDVKDNKLPINTVICGDCLEVMKDWPDKCVDLVLTDPPYGVTQNKWDIDCIKIINRIWDISDIWICNASQPFSSKLVMAHLAQFRHEWIWQKNRGSNFANTVREPFKEHEHILIFAWHWQYNPQMEERAETGKSRVNYTFQAKTKSKNYRVFERGPNEKMPKMRVPSSIQKFNTETGLHPTQKPVALMEYLIKTYSKENDLILDPFCGSGTTCVAAKMLGRRYIGIDISEEYCQIARDRLEAVDTGVPVKEARQGQKALFPAED